jgi:hypothetical protein
VVDKLDKKLSARPVLKEDLEVFVNRELVPIVEKLRLLTDALLGRLTEGEGSPEGVVTADIGAIYMRQDGTPGTLLYVKTADDSADGWMAFA